jgi:RNA polymerase sigma-70 factor, ECF subfamily
MSKLAKPGRGDRQSTPSESGAALATEAEFAQWLESMRPALHRYCARMMGSAVDGEDAVQDALLNAIEAYTTFASVENPAAWLYRITHNATMDLLRRRARDGGILALEADMDLIPDPAPSADERHLAHVALRSFMRLAPIQRSCIVLMDVLGYSLQELCAMTGTSLPAVKSSLHRGRKRLQELTQDSADSLPAPLSGAERTLLTAYVEHFNARNFDVIRDMLAEEVRLDLVARARMTGKIEVGSYLHNYADTADWRMQAGWIEGRAAVIVSHPAVPTVASYFILLEWERGKLLRIRDFRYARYVMACAEVRTTDA